MVYNSFNWAIVKAASQTRLALCMTYPTDERSRNSPADFPPETRIEAEHVIQCIVVIVNTCQRHIVHSVKR